MIKVGENRLVRVEGIPTRAIMHRTSTRPGVGQLPLNDFREM